jgi:hypothetical protein
MPADRPPTLDPVAADRWQRMAPAVSPWLHEEVAQRMQDRLQWIKLQPQAWAHWGAVRGGSEAAVAAPRPWFFRRQTVATPTLYLAATSRSDPGHSTTPPTASGLRFPLWLHDASLRGRIFFLRERPGCRFLGTYLRGIRLATMENPKTAKIFDFESPFQGQQNEV